MGPGDEKSPLSPASPDFSPSLDIWYKDGSVVLVTEKTAFRVHTSILAANCEVFRDMANIPQPSANDGPDHGIETYESCPVIRLSDSALDMKHFLKTIYDFSYFRPGMKAKFPVVTAVLRLSTKYEAPSLRQRAIDLLATAYPNTLAAWDTRSRLRLVPPFEAEIGSLFALAIETDVRAILPGLYYAASKRPLSTMLTELQSLPLNEIVRQDVISKFVIGQDKLHRAEITHILAFLDPLYQRTGCRTATDVGRFQNQASACILKTVDVTESYQQWCNDHPNEVGTSLFVCEICCTLVANTIKEGRQKIWDSLPEMFGLPAWETLLAENDLEEAIGLGAITADVGL